MRRKVLCASVLALLMACTHAWAVSLHNKAISTIPDILREARRDGIASDAESNLDLPKHSFIRYHGGYMDLRYNIGSGDADLSLGQIRDYSNGALSFLKRDYGTIAALLKTRFGERKVFAGSSTGFRVDGPWLYDIYFAVISHDITDTISQERFGAWRYNGDSTSGYIKDIKTGIFLENFDGELVAAATLESTNDDGSDVLYSTKKVNIRLDFWALFANDSGDVQYKKLDNLTTKREGYDTVPLQGMKAATNANWNVDLKNRTDASPYMLLKIATGDFNNDGYENEIAVLASDTKGIYLYAYQIDFNSGSGAFSVKEMSNVGTLYTYNVPSYFKKWSYNGFNRVPGGDIIAGDLTATEGQNLPQCSWVMLSQLHAAVRKATCSTEQHLFTSTLTCTSGITRPENLMSA